MRNGRILRHNLRQELVSVDELYAKLRQQGVEDVALVKSAFMESDGQISVIRLPDGTVPPTPSRPTQ